MVRGTKGKRLLTTICNQARSGDVFPTSPPLTFPLPSLFLVRQLRARRPRFYYWDSLIQKRAADPYWGHVCLKEGWLRMILFLDGRQTDESRREEMFGKGSAGVGEWDSFGSWYMWQKWLLILKQYWFNRLPFDYLVGKEYWWCL